MRKAIKLCLAFALIVPTTMITLNNEVTVIAAKVYGNYAYEIIDDDNVKITNYNGSESEVVVPSVLDGKTVTKIGYGAFAECKSIEKVTIPDSISVIEAYAFSQCSNIQAIELPESITSIGKYAFAGNTSLKRVSIPKKIRSLSYGLFFDCTSLENVMLPEGVESIGSVAFGNCKSLSTMLLPSTLISIDSNTFSECVSLSSIVLPEGVTFVGSGAFSGCLSLSNIQLPSTLLGIAQSAFKDCIALQTIDLPDNLNAIGYGAFSGCTSLQEIRIPSSITEISDATFSGCSSLTSLHIPDNIERIGAYAFSGCINLVDISISDEVEEIKANAFSYCRSLESVRLPKKLTVISESLFRYCDSLESIILPNGIKKIGATAFADCSSLTDITFPSSIEEKGMGSRILSNTPNATMIVSNNSEAHRYARQNAIPFRLLEAGINFDKTLMRLRVGEQTKLSVIMAPYTILDNKQLSWKSSDSQVASVDEDGNILANRVGEATITAQNSNGHVIAAQIYVDDNVVAITDITISAKTITMQINSSVGLRATINPGTTTMSKIVEWKSEDVEIATVNSTGSIFARQPGTTVIYATTSNGLQAKCLVTVTSDIKSISLNQTAMTLEVGAKQTLRATINPSNTTQDKAVSWTSSNEKVAIVNQNGELETRAPGTATITVKTTNGKKAECKITVTKPVTSIPITSVVLDKQTASLEIGEELTLQATINPSDTTEDSTLHWSSSNEQVASVINGKVVALQEGTSDIKVETRNGKSATCHVVVKRPVIEIESVQLNKTSLTLEEGLEEALVATILPATTTEDKTLLWSSSDETIATVAHGNVKAIKEGVTTITVTTSNGKEAICNVIVTKKPNPIMSIVLDVSATSLKVGKDIQLHATITPSDTSDDKTLTWTSSNEDIASVDKHGKVVALQEGEVTIYVTTSNGLQATCKITVFKITKEQLKASIEEANGVDANLYTLNSYQVLADTTLKAEELYKNDEATQQDVNDMVTLLQNAVLALQARASDVELEELSTILQHCKDLESSYSKVEFETMKKMIVEGDMILSNEKENIASKDVLNSIQALQEEKTKLDILASRGKLSQLIDIANTLLESDVSGIHPDHIEALRLAVRNSEDLLLNEQASVSELEASSQRLKQAIEQCERLVNKEQLKELIDICHTYQGDVYTESSWSKMQLELAKAMELYFDVHASQIDIDHSYNMLVHAFSNLQSKVNKTMLISNVELAKDILLHKTEYIPSSINTLEALITEANKIIEDSTATTEQVNELNTKVIKAIMKARKKGV